MDSAIKQLFNDPKYIECIRLAIQSKGEERYGSLIVKRSRIIGRGYNRAIATKTVSLERKISMGYANHAEVEALNDALAHHQDIRGATLYCAGYFPGKNVIGSEKNILYIKNAAVYTCTKCLPILEEQGIKNIIIPTNYGWSSMTIEEANKTASEFTAHRHAMRLKTVFEKYTLDIISHKL